ncbi:MAG: hypothetical protein ACRYGG_08600 [Janthinobacterium lividum]
MDNSICGIGALSVSVALYYIEEMEPGKSGEMIHDFIVGNSVYEIASSMVALAID